MRGRLQRLHFIPLDGVAADSPFEYSPGYYFGGKGGSAPATPNYVGAAQAQGAASKDTAMYNAALANPTQNTPYGSQTWNFTGSDINNPQPGQWQVSTTLSPQEQALLNSSLSTQLGLSNLAGGHVSQVSKSLSSPFDASSLPQLDTTNMSQTSNLANNLPSSVSAFQGLNDQAAKASYDQATQFYQENFQKASDALDAQLRNQGLTPGTTAYDTAMNNLQRNQNAAYTSAANQAVLTGNQVANQNYQNLVNALSAKSGYTTQQQQQQTSALQLASALRDMPLNELNALRTGNQVQMPGFGSYQQGTAQTPDILGATNAQYQGQLGAYSAQQAANSNFTSGLMGLGGTLGAASILAPTLSDRRLKRNIHKLGKLRNGLNWYSFQYLDNDDTQFGVMSDEVRMVIPEAVSIGSDGFDRVDYSKVL